MKEPVPSPSAPAGQSQELLLALHHENSAQARHHEQQRQWSTAIVALAAAMVLGLAAPGNGPLYHRYSLLLHAVFLLALGTFGFLASLHHHERSRLHVQRVHAVRRRISETLPVDILDLYAEANREHGKRFATLSNRTARIHYLWQGLHATVFFVGLALALLVLFVPSA